MSKTILSIDQGTTSSRAILFDDRGRVQRIAQQEFRQIFPHPGWVEHDPEEIWSSTVAVCREVLGGAEEVIAVGITNQRETTVVWDRATGRPIYNAIVWQDRRTAEWCQALRGEGWTEIVAGRTGLVLDPYFSATKIAWILDHVEGARAAAEAGRLAFGTIDTFLIWRLTGGKVHATDATNASRTLLFDIHRQCWDDELLTCFRIPRALLPEVRDSAADFGQTTVESIGRALPIAAVAGDQQAATVGQTCFRPGMIKSTYGTGCFAVMNTGEQVVRSQNGLLATVAYRLEGRPTYALEGSIFVAGAAVQWLRDALALISHAGETEALAGSLKGNDGVYLVPAFVGLGAPHWEPEARGVLTGLTRDSGIAHLVRAALESVCYQTRDLAEAMERDAGAELGTLRVDGGMVANRWMLQFLADTLDTPVERPKVAETTALGVAMLAGLQVGLYESLDELVALWELESRYEPLLEAPARAQMLEGWARALMAVRAGIQPGTITR